MIVGPDYVLDDINAAAVSRAQCRWLRLHVIVSAHSNFSERGAHAGTG